MITDVYKTIEKPIQEVVFKDKKSKFFGYVFPVFDENDVKNQLDILKKKHPNANHICYAYQLGIEQKQHRANDDGEPNNTAGAPIYAQIQSFDVTNILVVVVRYFGGTKLGVSGLINAYKTTAQLTLQASIIIEKTIDVCFQLNFEYELMNLVMRIIKENDVQILNQKLELNCELVIAIRKKDAEKVYYIFDALHKVKIKKLES